MGIIQDRFIALTKQLYPTGRAFNIHSGSMIERLHEALSVSEESTYLDIVSTLDSILPDNANFTADDATLWEKRLGMITNELVPLQDRKDAIIRKLNHPGTIKARQNYKYIQDQLQLAGFNVWIHENPNQYSPDYLLSLILGLGEMGEPEMGELEMGTAEFYYPDLFIVSEMGEIEMGDFEMDGIYYNNLIANRIEESLDVTFDIGSNLRATFFVGGETLGTFADVDVQRKDEFRQLILKLKPVQSIGFLLINYI